MPLGFRQRRRRNGGLAAPASPTPADRPRPEAAGAWDDLEGGQMQSTLVVKSCPFDICFTPPRTQSSLEFGSFFPG